MAAVEIVAGVVFFALCVVSMTMLLLGCLGALGALRLGPCPACGALAVRIGRLPATPCARCRHAVLGHPLHAVASRIPAHDAGAASGPDLGP